MDKELKEFFGAAKTCSLRSEEKQRVFGSLQDGMAQFSVREDVPDCHKNTMKDPSAILGKAKAATLSQEEKSSLYDEVQTFVEDHPVHAAHTPLWERFFKLPVLYVPAVALIVFVVLAKDQIPFPRDGDAEPTMLRQGAQADDALRILTQNDTGVRPPVPTPESEPEALMMMQAVPPGDTAEKQGQFLQNDEAEPPQEVFAEERGDASTTSVRMVSITRTETTVADGITVKRTESYEENSFVSVSGPPRVSVLSPESGAVNVDTAARFSVTFSENVALGEGGISIRRFDDESVVATLAIPSAYVTQTGSMDMSFRLVHPLSSDEHYFITLAPGSVVDTDKEPFGGIKEKTVWHFITSSSIEEEN